MKNLTIFKTEPGWKPDFAIMTGMYSVLIGAVVEALGGEA